MEKVQEYLLENLFDGVYYVDTDRIITYWNKSAEQITGYEKEAVIGKRCSDSILKHIDINGKELCKAECPLYKSLQNEKTLDADLFLHHKDGHRVPVSVRVSPVRDDDGKIIGAVEIFTDKSERADLIRHFEKIKKETLIDPVSKTGNRKYAQFHLNNRYMEMKMYKVFFGMLFFKIDNFQKVSDGYGEHIVQGLLEMAAKSAKNCLKTVDVVARWEDETFIAIIPNIENIEMLKELGERIRKFIEHSWLHIKNTIVQVTVSVGGTLSKKEDSMESLIERAEKHLNNAVNSGGNCSDIS